jgi:glutamate synthase (NADPH/NADH) large chain
MTGGRAVILGRTGRNFGAGMSGGVAYVFDADNTFRRRVNHEMVDLDPLDGDDLDWLRECISRHVAETASVVGTRILARWAQDSERFVKVMPQDYKRVLEAARQAREQGIDEIEAIMAAAHG